MGRKNILARAFPALGYGNVANFLTILGVAIDVLIVGLAASGNVKWAVWSYAFVLAIDGMDGKVARLLKCAGDFGARLDSLCDAVSFCLMPAVLAAFLGFASPAAIALMALNAAAGVWRLAYFDLKGLRRVGEREYYVGAPTTRSAAVFYMVLTIGGLFRERLDLALYAFFAVSPLLMLAAIPMRKNSRAERSFFVLVPLSAVAFLFIW